MPDFEGVEQLAWHAVVEELPVQGQFARFVFFLTEPCVDEREGLGDFLCVGVLPEREAPLVVAQLDVLGLNALEKAWRMLAGM